jgi:hypothetical protein
MCFPLLNFEPIGRIYEIQLRGQATEVDFEAIVFNAISQPIQNGGLSKL